MKKMKVKLMLIIGISLLMMLCINKTTYASEIQKGEFSQKYKEWLELSDEEKNDSIPPLPINIRGKLPESPTSTGIKKFMKKATDILANNQGLPEKYDLRDDINIEVKDQMSASQCWAFSALSSLETFLSLQNQNYSFSERHIDYDTSISFIEGPKEDSLNREVSDGGYVGTAFTYFSRGSGPVLEEDMPFKNHENLISQSELPVNRTIQKVDNMIYFPQIYKNEEGECTDANGEVYSDETVKYMRDEIKRHIMKNGGITVSILGPSTREYINLYTGEYEIYYNEETSAWFSNNQFLELNHAVTIIGWDDTYSKDNFVIKPKNDGAYIVLNSYGTAFGENGIYYISYEDLLVETQMRGYTSVSNVNYDNIYQYDISEIYNYVESPYAANLFKAKGNEILTEIMIGSMLEQHADIYINIANEPLNINDATKIANNVYLSPGYNTIKLDSNIELKEGDTFAIIVKLLDEGAGVGVEDDTSPFARVTSKQNESFCSDDGINWNDIYDENKMMNFSIKAYTRTNENDGNITQIKYSTRKLLEGVGGSAQIYLKTTTANEEKNVNILIFNNQGENITSQFVIDAPKIENTLSKIIINVSDEIEAGTYTVKIMIDNKILDEKEFQVVKLEETADYVRIHFPDINLYEALKEKNVLTEEQLIVYFDDKQEVIVRKDICKLDFEGTFIRPDGTIKYGTGYNITNLEGLENFTELKDLQLAINEISDLSPISNLTNLQYLGLYNNRGTIENLDDLTNLNELITLEITASNITDISALSNLTKLSVLDLQYNNITNISSLVGLKELNYLDLTGNPVVDVSLLGNLTKLTTLILQLNGIKNIEALGNLINLNTLYIDINEINDITPLANLTEIVTLALYGNHISDISVLENLNKLENLDMSNCNISDISVLNNLENLNVDNVLFWAQNLEKNISNINEVIEIPQLFKDALNSDSLAYCEEGLQLEDCYWVEEGKTIKMNDGCERCSIKIPKGKAMASEFVVMINNVYIDVKEISITVQPDKLTYKKGEDIDLTGGKLLVKYEDDSEEEIDLTAEDITISNYYPDSIGRQEIFIQYKGQMTALWITIVESQEDFSEVRSIAVEREPYNKEFFKGDELLFNGGTLFVIYMDDSNEIIPFNDEEITFSGYNPEQLGEQKITINYRGVTTNLLVTVIEKQTEDNYLELLPYLIAKDSKNGYLENINEGTTCKDIIDVAYTNGIVEIYKGDKLVDNLNEKLATGMEVKVIFTNEEYSYKIVVTGDINGDSEVDELDLLMLARYNAGYEKENDLVVNESLRATNLYKDDYFGDEIDLLKLARMLVNLD